MSINICSTAGKHLNLWRLRIPQQINSHGENWRRRRRFWISTVPQRHLPDRSGPTSVINLYILWIIASAGCSNFNPSFTTFLFRRGNFMTSVVHLWYCSTLLLSFISHFLYDIYRLFKCIKITPMKFLLHFILLNLPPNESKKIPQKQRFSARL